MTENETVVSQQVMPTLADLVTATKHRTPPRIVLHGPEKVGKSTFFAGAPDPVFIQTEDGLTGIDAFALPLCSDYNQMIEQIGMLCTEEHAYKSVILDSADWAERLIHTHVCTIEDVSNIEKAQGGYGKGYLEALNLWRSLLRGLDYLNKEKGMIIGVICHSRIVSINDPLNEVYDSYQMKLHDPKSGNGSSALLREWADILLFADTEKFTHKITKQGGNEKKAADKLGRATTSGRHFIYTRPSPAYAAGNRYSLPPQLDMSYAALEDALKKTV